MFRRPLLAGLCLAFAACRATLPSQLPADAQWLVAVKSCALPSGNAWWKSWAHHAWVDIRRGDTQVWERIESGGRWGIVHMDLGADEAQLDRRFGERVVRLLGWVDGDAARRAIARIDAALPSLAEHYANGYATWPGPNSNTFVRELLAGVPELGFVFDPNCVGKDYSAWLGIGATASKTGLRLDTPILGAAVGLREGLELHALQLTFGISLDPPGLSLPFLPQIPWGWFGAEPARLVPPTLPGAQQLVLDAGALNGERRPLGIFGPGSVLLVTRPDQRAWLRLDATAAAPPARDLRLEIERHEQDGVLRYGAELRGEPDGPPLVQRLQCDAAVILLDLQPTTDGRFVVGARCFPDLDAEFLAMQQPDPSAALR